MRKTLSTWILAVAIVVTLAVAVVVNMQNQNANVLPSEPSTTTQPAETPVATTPGVVATATPQPDYAEVVWRFLEVERLQDPTAYNTAVEPLVTAAYLPELLRPSDMPTIDMGGLTYTIDRKASKLPGKTITDSSGTRAYVEAFPYFIQQRGDEVLGYPPGEPREFTLVIESGIWKIAEETVWVKP